jgi:hypothetical protein
MDRRFAELALRTDQPKLICCRLDARDITELAILFFETLLFIAVVFLWKLLLSIWRMY